MVYDSILYDRLEVSPNASEIDIRKAFNRLSKIWHPDKRTEDEDKNIATQKFQEITEAKEILLDSEKRSRYDQLGINMLNPENQFANMNNPFSGFESMFNHNFPFGVKKNTKKIEDIIKTLDITLEQIYNEEIINLSYSQKNYCTTCNGEGTSNGHKNICKLCNGKGMNIQLIRMGPMIQQTMVNCNVCNGTGKLVDANNKCKICDGKCYINKIKNIQIPLKAGLTHNNKICLSGKGNQHINEKSDLILIINELPHSIFKRHENDLYMELEIKLYQALFGFDKIITHLDNRILHINSINSTNFNCIKKIHNEGMKSIQKNKKGDLYIKFIINIPDLLVDNNLKEQLKSLLQLNEKSEVDNEKLIINNLTYIKTILNDCDKDNSNYIDCLFNNLNSNDNSNNNNNNESENNDNNNNNNNPECVQS